MSSIVYVLTNEAMPGIIKIGRTSGDSPQARMNQLYSPGVPLPFECAFAIKTDDEAGTELEKALHRAFVENRLNPSREFFWMDAECAKAILEVWPNSEEVTPEFNQEEGNADADAVKRVRRRRPNMNFIEMGILAGSILVCVHNGEEATVVDERKVRFRDEETSITQATRLALGLGASRSIPVIRRQWSYEGRNLSEIYEETYGGM